MAKLIRLSADGTNWFSLPSNSADLSIDGEQVDDSILGTTFSSSFTSLLNWNFSGDGIYKGVAGYQTCILKQGTSTATTGEDMSQVTGQIYQIDDATKNLFDAAVAYTVFDGVTDVTDEVVNVNYLFGTITFDSSYTVVGDITIDVNYFPVAVIGRFNSFTLTQSVDAVDDSDFQTLKANGGFRLNKQGLRTVSLEASGIFDATSDFRQQLVDRDAFVLEIQADSTGLSKARGYFRIGTTSQSGAVGDNEEESVTFNLNVPSSDYSPFEWSHATTSTLSDAILVALNAFNSETNVFIEYLPNGIGGAAGATGQGVITDISLSSSVDDMPRFTIELTNDGALTDVI